MAKTTHVTTSNSGLKAGATPRKLAAAPVRLERKVSGQSKKGLGKPHP